MKICLPILSFLMHRMLSVGQPVLEHCDPIIHLNYFESLERPFSWSVCDHKTKQ